MQIDIDPEQIGRNYPVEIGAVAELSPQMREGIPEFLEAVIRYSDSACADLQTELFQDAGHSVI